MTVVAKIPVMPASRAPMSAREASRDRGGAFAGVVVVRGAAERLNYGEPEDAAWRRKRGGGARASMAPGVWDKGAGVPRGGLKEGEGIRASGKPRGEARITAASSGGRCAPGKEGKRGRTGDLPGGVSQTEGERKERARLRQGKRAPTGGARASVREKEEGARPGAGPAAGRGRPTRGGKRRGESWATGEGEERGLGRLGWALFFFSFPFSFPSSFLYSTNSNKSN
jgi:hypothetical protein